MQSGLCYYLTEGPTNDTAEVFQPLDNSLRKYEVANTIYTIGDPTSIFASNDSEAQFIRTELTVLYIDPTDAKKIQFLLFIDSYNQPMEKDGKTTYPIKFYKVVDRQVVGNLFSFKAQEDTKIRYISSDIEY